MLLGARFDVLDSFGGAGATGMHGSESGKRSDIKGLRRYGRGNTRERSRERLRRGKVT